VTTRTTTRRYPAPSEHGDDNRGDEARHAGVAAGRPDPVYESLARKGEAMTTAAMVNYAYDQIDQARAELNAVSK
jgi:hypothetical protein